jgi:hypothetical protein
MHAGLNAKTKPCYFELSMSTGSYYDYYNNEKLFQKDCPVTISLKNQLGTRMMVNQNIVTIILPACW